MRTIVSFVLSNWRTDWMSCSYVTIPSVSHRAIRNDDDDFSHRSYKKIVFDSQSNESFTCSKPFTIITTFICDDYMGQDLFFLSLIFFFSISLCDPNDDDDFSHRSYKKIVFDAHSNDSFIYIGWYPSYVKIALVKIVFFFSKIQRNDDAFSRRIALKKMYSCKWHM